MRRPNPLFGSPSLWQIIKSVLASFLGVQTHQNYEHDFTQSTSIVPFIVVGVVMVVLLVLSILGIALLVT
ncbi:DUF2970 domain-containing protein [Glaciecola siphonariae]|uniref:DUF2970 domain-containing protein n=1 Tax=Glaciecola siphonariae TaxID=521012 RepID=A0ABV9LWM5_9ALTE